MIKRVSTVVAAVALALALAGGTASAGTRVTGGTGAATQACTPSPSCDMTHN
jgi:hypothetical protein